MSKRPCPDWLRHAVFYEVYPQSFRDSNGDGIGDLPGLLSKLDYIRSLGCNAIWINPCFVSPFDDAGYDIADYGRVAPRYGTNADLRRVFRAAHRRGMRVVLDLVPGHTSYQHPWFRASCQAGRNAFSDRYIWTEHWIADAGSGVRAIPGMGARDGQYVTNFFWCQPALNFGFARPDPSKPWQLPVDHPACQATRREIWNIIRFWLREGADGFRVDMAASLVKQDKGFRENIRLWNEVRAPRP